MILTKNHSTLNTTKSDSYRIISPHEILQESLIKISSKFATSDSFYLVHNINQVVQSKFILYLDKKCRLKEIIKD